MKQNLIIVCFSIFLKISAQKNTDFQLELVQVLFRHGARTPSREEAGLINVTDPSIYGSLKFHQLTNEGKERMYRLGSLLRKYYNEFLGNYRPQDLYAYSSASTRTKMSLQLVTAGLYPPSLNNSWNPKLNWNPIPYEQAETLCDSLVTPHQCIKYADTLYLETYLSKDYEQLIAKYSELHVYLEKITGKQYRNNINNILYNSGWTYYAMKIHKMMNLPLPDWCTNEIYHKLTEFTSLILDIMSFTNKLKRINGGTMIRRMLENIETNKNLQVQKKIYLYCAHDLTLGAFIKSQAINSFDIPPFGSAIILEKYKNNNGEEYVKMQSYDGSSEVLQVIQINGSEDYYPLLDYKVMVQDVIPTDEEIDFLVSEKCPTIFSSFGTPGSCLI